jgi:hypothetical protein
MNNRARYQTRLFLCLQYYSQLFILGEQIIAQKQIDETKSKIISMLQNYEVDWANMQLSYDKIDDRRGKQ